MADNVTLIVNETIDNVVINPSITTEVVDVNVSGTDTYVDIAVTPNLTTVNINQIAGVISQNLQEVTNVGSTTTNSITANSFVKSGGTGLNVLLDDGTTKLTTSILGTTNLSTTQTASNFTINSDTGTDASVPLGNGTNAGASLNNYTTAEQTKLAGIATGAEVNVNADWNASTGDAQILNKPTIPSISGLATVTYVDTQDALKQNNITLTTTGTSGASTLVGATLNIPQYSGATNLTTSQTSTNFTINSSTGDDASVPLGNGTLAGATLNDYTSAEKTKLAGIASGATVGVPYTGAVSDVNLGEFGIQLGNLEFDNTPTNIPTTAGSMYYNDADGTLDLKLKGGNVTLQVGQETVIRVVNKTATNITLLEANYQAVRITGAQGQRPKVDLSQATTDVLSSETIGLVTETIANNQEGFVTTSGLVRGINTTGSLQSETWLDGDILYLSPTVAGRITKVKPTAPNHLIIIGYVISAHITQGTIFVKVDNGYELDELHNVKITTAANNNVLAYTSATDIWENKTVETALGFTPYNATNPSGYQTAGQVQTIADAKVADAINDGTTTVAPSQNAVFDALALKANIASPTFTGTPLLTTTPTTGDNTTKIASTAFVKTAVDSQVYNITIGTGTGTGNKTTESVSDVGGYSQNGRNVMVNNGATAIIITVNTASATDFIASYTKLGSANIEFQAGTATLIGFPSFSASKIISGVAGSTALLTRTGNTFYLQINNLAS